MPNSVSNSTSNIYLVGMPGSGKTATGKCLAQRFSKKFLDLDEVIVERESSSISEIFKTKGEDHFRKCETKYLKEVASHGGQVIATGGGIVLKPNNWGLMRLSGKVVYLKTSIEWILKRTAGTKHRPLLEAGSEEERKCRIEGLLKERKVLYEKSDHTVETDGKTAEAVAVEIQKKLEKK